MGRKREETTPNLPWFGNSAYIHFFFFFLQVGCLYIDSMGKRESEKIINVIGPNLHGLGPDMQWDGLLGPTKI